MQNKTYTIGNLNGKPIEWLMLEELPDKALLISKDCLMQKPYDESFCGASWMRCTLRNEVLPELAEQIFSEEEQSRILTVTNKNPNNTKYGTRGGDDTEDKLFLLSIDEAKQYFSDNKSRIAYAFDVGFRLNKESVWWWLRSPGFYSSLAASIFHDGGVYDYGYSVSRSGGVRPAFWLNLKS